MTCIASLKSDGKVWIGGDSAGVNVESLSITARADRKVFLKTDVVGVPYGFGFTSSFRMGQLIQYHLEIPAVPDKMDLHEFLATSFIFALRNCLKDGGWAIVENNKEQAGTFLVATRGRVFMVDSDYQVGESLHDFSAVGCGEDIALGSLYSTNKTKLTPVARVELALRAAAEFSAGVRGPFSLVQL